MKKEEIRALGAAIRRHFQAFWPVLDPEKVPVLLYASFRNEADTWGILEDLLAQGGTALLPRTRKSGLEIYEYRGPESLKENALGILDPDPEKCPPADPSAIRLAVVPGVAFDRKGGRLGFGAGYYDRFLPLIPSALKVGLCYESQIADSLPTEDTDVPMDYLLTEKGLFNCRTQSYIEL